MPAQLHQNPVKLRELLQTQIDEFSRMPGVTAVVIAYGVCGRGALGLYARDVPLVLPRTQDCIGIFLGSHSRYTEQFSEQPGTRYLTHGWYQKTSAKKPADNHYDKRNDSLYGVTRADLAAKYGPENADFICEFRESWKRNYRRAAYISFAGEPENQPGRQVTKGLAESLNWAHDDLEGDDSLLLAMLSQKWADPRLLIVPAGSKTVASPGDDVIGHASGVESRVDSLLQRYEGGALTKTDRHGIGLGIDTGGTFTDAVIYDFDADEVLAFAKAPTTHGNLLSGIVNVLRSLPADTLRGVERVGLSTTLATNAFVERKGRPVALLLMSPFRIELGEFPFRVTRHIPGSLTMDGAERVPVQIAAVRAAAREAMAAGCEAVAISGFGSVINPVHELEAAEVVLAETGLHTVCGHELTSTLNFIERATTAAMNAKLVPLVEALIDATEKALNDFGLADVRVMLVKGDGSQMLADAARKVPVETVLSGPAASVVGAARLFGERNAIVADMGGTTLDVAMLRDGLPVLSDRGSMIADFQTSVRAMALQTVGLGGDSEIDLSRWPNVTIGPRRIIPICRLGEQHPDAVNEFIRVLPDIISRDRNAADVVALTPGVKASGDRLLTRLASVPLPLAILARRMNRTQPAHIPWDGHETDGRIVRYGLTLTDILHAEGRFNDYDSRPVSRLLSCWSMLLEAPIQDILDAVHHEFRRMVCDAVMRVALPEDCPWDSDSPLCRWLTKHMTENADTDGPRFQIKSLLHYPLVGVGAPVGTLFPELESCLSQKVLTSEYSAVANAVGAIAGDVRLRVVSAIRATDDGSFVCSWRGGNLRATCLEEALDACESALCSLLRRDAEANEIPYSQPVFRPITHQANTKEGDVFFGITLHAELRG